MHSRHSLAGIGAAIACLLVTSLSAAAQSVPLPVPAPHSKMRQVNPPPKLAKPLPNGRHVAQVTGTAGGPATPPAHAAPIGIVRAGGPPFDANQQKLVDRASSYLSGINALTGNFVQIGPDGSRTEGRLYLQKPGRVRFEYNPPSPVELIADGSSIAVRDRKLNTQEIIPLSQTPLRFLVAERIDLSKDTNVIAISSDDTFATVVIEERQTLGGTYRLMLMFGARDFQLRQWTITDPQGFDTTVALYNLDPKQKPDPSLFKIDYTRYIQ